MRAKIKKVNFSSFKLNFLLTLIFGGGKLGDIKEIETRTERVKEDSMSFLELHDIYKSYFLGKEEFPVLKGINLSFDRGDFVSILGESGGGKSTLMNIIGGLDREFQGNVTINGQRLDHSKEKQMDEYRRGMIGYIYQSYNLINHLTVLENVLVSLEMTKLTNKEKHDRAMELLKQVGLETQVKKHPNQLSGGQKQRVAIARALASDPQVIIADEPTGALDSQNTQEVLAILDQIAASGKLVIAVTHSQEVADYGTRIVHLADGVIESDTRLKEGYPLQNGGVQIEDRPLPSPSSYKTAFKHLTYNWKQNSIIVLGTAIGIFAVLLFSGLGNGIKAYINDQVNSLANPNIVTVMKNVTDDKKTANTQRIEQTRQKLQTDYAHASISSDDLKKMTTVKHVKKVQGIYNFAASSLSLGSKKTTAAIQSWSVSYNEDVIKSGDKPGKNEMLLDKQTAALLTDKKAKTLIGKTINVQFTAVSKQGLPVPVTLALKVSGITDGGQAGAINAPTSATVKEALVKAGASTNYMAAVALASQTDDVKQVAKGLNQIKTDGKRAFVATTIGSILDTINTIVNLASYVLAAIAGISLIVSALMIIATMYMSVAERTKEIGILRALGESKRDIRRLFTSEALFIGLISAVIALGLAYGLGMGVLNTALYGIAKFNMVQISIGNVVFAFVIALLISFLAALLPSRKAAKLNPIDALAAD